MPCSTPARVPHQSWREMHQSWMFVTSAVNLPSGRGKTFIAPSATQAVDAVTLGYLKTCSLSRGSIGRSARSSSRRCFVRLLLFEAYPTR